MERKAVSRTMLTLLIVGILTLGFSIQPVKAEPSEPPAIEWSRTLGGANKDRTSSIQQTSDGGYITESVGSFISVPYHPQSKYYYCGPASLEMVFDFYGPDISQIEIADVARTAPDGTYTCDMVRAAHFSNLSTSVGREMTGNVTGYTARKLGYAAFEHWGMTIDELKSLIDSGFPVIVLTTWHYRVAVAYNSAYITFQDSWYGRMHNMTWGSFDVNWDYSNHWGLFISPWKVEVSTLENILLGNVFNVTVTITYPAPPPFHRDQYPASVANAIITLPAGLVLVSGETAKKTIGIGDLAVGASANVTWTVQATSLGNYTVSVEAEGKVNGFVPPLPSYPEFYRYEDRIGGYTGFNVTVLPRSPTKLLDELARTVESWNLDKGIETSLTSKLQASYRSLERGNQNAPVGQLTAVINEVQGLRLKKLTNEHAEQLIREAQRIIDLING